MSKNTTANELFEVAHGSQFELSRRCFVQLLGAGLLITVTEGVSLGQRRSSRGSGIVAARLRINTDGTITVMTGKVEEGQGSRTQLTLAAAEELRVSADRIRLIMADTALVPDDVQYGSGASKRCGGRAGASVATCRRTMESRCRLAGCKGRCDNQQ